MAISAGPSFILAQNNIGGFAKGIKKSADRGSFRINCFPK